MGEWAPVRRFLSNYFDLLLVIALKVRGIRGILTPKMWDTHPSENDACGAVRPIRYRDETRRFGPARFRLLIAPLSAADHRMSKRTVVILI